ncbi:unnamed protein product, partial [Bubo scandiacus]
SMAFPPLYKMEEHPPPCCCGVLSCWIISLLCSLAHTLIPLQAVSRATHIDNFPLFCPATTDLPHCRDSHPGFIERKS